jgi:hypothetical protein
LRQAGSQAGGKQAGKRAAGRAGKQEEKKQSAPDTKELNRKRRMGNRGGFDKIA